MPDEPISDSPTEGLRRFRSAKARLAFARLTPVLSASTTALVALTAMTLSALSFPTLLHAPRWLEWEAVLASWWAMGWLGLTVFLYRGVRMDDDHTFHAPNSSLAERLNLGSGSSCGDGCADPGCTPEGGCDDIAAFLLLGAVAMLAAAATVVVAWLLVELIMPLTFLAFYFTFSAALRRAARDRHDCPGRLLPSLKWGFLWATLYVAPLALTLFALHRIAPR